MQRTRLQVRALTVGQVGQHFNLRPNFELYIYYYAEAANSGQNHTVKQTRMKTASLSHNSTRHAVQYKRPVATWPPINGSRFTGLLFTL